MRAILTILTDIDIKLQHDMTSRDSLLPTLATYACIYLKAAFLKLTVCKGISAIGEQYLLFIQ